MRSIIIRWALTLTIAWVIFSVGIKAGVRLEKDRHNCQDEVTKHRIALVPPEHAEATE